MTALQYPKDETYTSCYIQQDVFLLFRITEQLFIKDISYGEKWAEKIADGLINDTALFVFILSENSNNSDQVLKEINIAIN